MRSIFVACLLLTACCSNAELSHGGASVVMADVEPAGCRSLGTVRESEGGGFRSFGNNRDLAELRMRNEAARLGGNSIVVISEERGDTDTGAGRFTTGVAGLASPNPRCTNCVEMMARVYSCAGQAPAPVAVSVEPPRSLPEPAAEPPMAPPPPAAPPSWAVPPPAAPPTIIIIIQPPMLPPER